MKFESKPFTEEEKEMTKIRIASNAKFVKSGADISDDGSLEATKLQKEQAREEMGEIKFGRLTDREMNVINNAYRHYGKNDEKINYFEDDAVWDAVISKTDLDELRSFDYGAILDGEEEEVRKNKTIEILRRIRIEK